MSGDEEMEVDVETVAMHEVQLHYGKHIWSWRGFPTRRAWSFFVSGLRCQLAFSCALSRISCQDKVCQVKETVIRKSVMLVVVIFDVITGTLVRSPELGVLFSRNCSMAVVVSFQAKIWSGH